MLKVIQINKLYIYIYLNNSYNEYLIDIYIYEIYFC
jgi:hypothetical protein